MYKKLVVSAFLLFGLVLWFTLNNKKTTKAPPFYHYLPDAEIYGKISTNEFLKIVKRFVIYKGSDFSINDTEFNLVLDRLNDLGLSKEQIYMTGNPTDKNFAVYVKIKDLNKAKQEFSTLAYTFDWEEMIRGENTVYFQESENFFFVLHPKVLIFKYGDTFLAKDDELLKKEASPKRFYNLDTLFQEPNSIIIQTKEFKKLDIDYLLVNLSLNDSIIMDISLKTNEKIPIKLKENGIAFERNKEEDVFLNLDLDLSRLTLNEQWEKEMEKVSNIFGLDLRSTLLEWNGKLSFRRGGETIITDTIVEINFNENFEEVEEIKVVKKPVTCFEIVLGTMHPSSMVKALQSNGFLSKQKQHYFLPFSPPLFINKQSECLILSTSNNYSQKLEILDKSSNNSLYYHNNYFKIIAKIKSIQSDELRLDASIDVLDAEE